MINHTFINKKTTPYKFTVCALIRLVSSPATIHVTKICLFYISILRKCIQHVSQRFCTFLPF